LLNVTKTLESKNFFKQLKIKIWTRAHVHNKGVKGKYSMNILWLH